MPEWIDGRERIIPVEYADRRNLRKAFCNGFLGASLSVTGKCPGRYEANPPLAAAYRRGFEAFQSATPREKGSS